MGRKRKPPVRISATQGGTEVPLNDGLPVFERFIDLSGQAREQKILTRLFFVTPSVEEEEETTKLYQSNEIVLAVIGARMSYMMKMTNCATPLFEYCVAKQFSEDFAANLVRLVISHLRGKHLGRNSIKNFDQALREFVDFLATRSEKPLVLTDINKQIWLDYLAFCEADHRTTIKQLFNGVRALFKNYAVTSLGGWLGAVTFRQRKCRKASQEHTSELAETKDYSDVVLYQLLALFVEGFLRRIRFLKHYESLTEADMPQNWIYPGRRAVRTSRGKSDTTELILKWLSDSDENYQLLIDHYLMHHKAGLLTRNRFGETIGGIATNFKSIKRYSDPFIRKFWETMGHWHGYDYPRTRIVSLLDFYLKKKTATEVNLVINQIGWCLANLVMMQTGVNKEVVLTIPSKAENGASILTRGDTLFISKDGATEIELYGIKAKTGNAPRKVIPITIAKNCPLYEMLLDYERHVKVGDGPFFEFDNNFINGWSIAGGVKNLGMIYPVIDENGTQLSTIDSTRFRKVFASGQLLDRLKSIKDGNELAEKLRDDLKHGNLDTTITNYLLKSTVARSVIDIAIATITSDILQEGLRFRGQVALGNTTQCKKKVFLCHCKDPLNPSHDVAIADECKHYDLCLGCQQSIITKEHLPYICLRILQYEAEREKDNRIWPAIYEDRWCIAHDALDRYMATDQKHGRCLVDEAWVAAREGRVSLPPVIVSNRM